MIARAYEESTSIRDAIATLGEHDDVSIVAGGTDLIVAMKSGRLTLRRTILAIHRIDDLRTLERLSGGGLRCGALVTHHVLDTSSLVRREWTALAEAAAVVGSPATRCAGTIGGNVANASPAMDLGSPLLVFDAVVELASQRGVRRENLAKFLRGPGMTTLASDELLVQITLPPVRKGATGSAYVRIGYREAMEIAVVGVAALVTLDGPHIVDARLALTAVAPVCIRVIDAESALAHARPESDVIRKAAQLAAEHARPIDDVRASAKYRRAMVRVAARRALEAAITRARSSAALSGDGPSRSRAE